MPAIPSSVIEPVWAEFAALIPPRPDASSWLSAHWPWADAWTRLWDTATGPPRTVTS